MITYLYAHYFPAAIRPCCIPMIVFKPDSSVLLGKIGLLLLAAHAKGIIANDIEVNYLDLKMVGASHDEFKEV